MRDILIAIMPAIVAALGAGGPVVAMLAKANENKKKVDHEQNLKIDKISEAIELLREGREKNAQDIQEIRGILNSTHNDIKTIGIELREQGIALEKQVFYAESKMPAEEKLFAGMKYICYYHENGTVFRDVIAFAKAHPEALRAILLLKPEYREVYEKRVAELEGGSV
ncbi:MAG: hypothetical protein LBD07_02530 [Spirochaetaceae bacterium]|jgi:vacuolar-type H+-ATPase subunit I/STV1|nr:hypothetical protein [Spirochaetaceae bacterium]